MKYSCKQLYEIGSRTLEKTGRIEIGWQFSIFSLTPFSKIEKLLRFEVSGRTNALKTLKRITFIEP